MFKDLVDKRFGIFPNLADSALKPAIAVIAICQTLGVWIKDIAKPPETILSDPSALECIPIVGLENMVHVISSMSLATV